MMIEELSDKLNSNAIINYGEKSVLFSKRLLSALIPSKIIAPLLSMAKQTWNMNPRNLWKKWITIWLIWCSLIRCPANKNNPVQKYFSFMEKIWKSLSTSVLSIKTKTKSNFSELLIEEIKMKMKMKKTKKNSTKVTKTRRKPRNKSISLSKSKIFLCWTLILWSHCCAKKSPWVISLKRPRTREYLWRNSWELQWWWGRVIYTIFIIL